MEEFHEVNPAEPPINVSSENELTPRKRGIIRDIIETMMLAALFFLLINAVTARIKVDGFSMLPTLNNGEYILVNKLAYNFGAPSYGDIVVFQFPMDPDLEYIKRVIGLPGDKVRISESSVFVNGNLLDENYIKFPSDYQGIWQVPEDQFFVLGDNRPDSSDSHDWGSVGYDNLIGEAIFVYWPPRDWGLITEHGPVFAKAQ